MKFGNVLCLIATSTLTGCGPGGKQVLQTVGIPISSAGQSCSNGHHNIFAAAPLCDYYPVGSGGSLITAATADADSQTAGKALESREFVGAALSDSITKCNAFITTFTGAQSGENLVLDITSLALTGLAALGFPATTVRDLAAGSTFTQGTKAAINSDMFQQLTIQLFIQQINSTYYAELKSFESTISNGQPVVASIALPEIQLFHKDCSVVFAAANISTNQKTPALLGTIKNDAMTVGAKFKASNGSIYQISATVPAAGPPASVTSVTYTVTPVGGAPNSDTASTSAFLALLNQESAEALP